MLAKSIGENDPDGKEPEENVVPVDVRADGVDVTFGVAVVVPIETLECCCEAAVRTVRSCVGICMTVAETPIGRTTWFGNDHKDNLGKFQKAV